MTPTLLWTIFSAWISGTVFVFIKLILFIRTHDKEMSNLNINIINMKNDFDLEIAAKELEIKQLEHKISENEKINSRMHIEFEKSLLERDSWIKDVEKANKESFNELNKTLKELSDTINAVATKFEIYKAKNDK